MDDFYQIDLELDVPIYQQLVDSIRTNIKTGKMPAGLQLPTVRGLSDELGVACGTVKRAYDQLEAERYIEKRQGRGTFVCYRAESDQSRKARAMSAIDGLLEELEDMHFSMAEINIFLNLKLQERAAKQDNLKIAAIENSPELLSQMCEQIRVIERVDLFAFTLEEVMGYPYKLEEMDLIVTTKNHAQTISARISNPEKLIKVILEPSVSSIIKLTQLPANGKVGVICGSRLYGDYAATLCRHLGTKYEPSLPCLPGEDCRKYLKDKAVVLVPEGYERYCGQEAVAAVDAFRKHGQVISCHTQIDGGSMLYLTERVRSALEKLMV